MRKMTFIMTLFVTLMLTPLAVAQGWKLNEVTNRTTKNVYLVFSTWRPARAPLPAGFRITGHYELRPNQTHKFYALDNRAYYLQVWHPDLKIIKPTAGRNTFSAPVIADPFEMVVQRQISAGFRSNTILYQQPSRNYPLEDGFLKYQNTGTPIDITSAWVNIDTQPLPEEPETTRRPDDNTTPPPHPPDEAPTDNVPPVHVPPTPQPTIETPPVIGITSLSGTTLNQGTTTQLTISVSENGNPAAGKALVLHVPTDKATISPTSGSTSSNGQLLAILTIHKSATAGTFNVTATIAGTTHSTTLPITVQIGAGQISLSASPSAVEPGQRATVTIAARTTTGGALPGAQISLSSAFGNIQPTLVVTNAQGQATATWTAPAYTGTPHINVIATNTITATVVANPTVKGTTRIPMRYTPGSLSVSGVPSSLTSGQSRTITVTVKSKTGRLLKDVPVNITESSRYIRFSQTSGFTNSSGKLSSTLRSGGETSGASFNVSTVGFSRRYTVRVNAGTQSVTRSLTLGSSRGSVGECTFGGLDKYWTSRSYVSFPDRVLSYRLRTSVSQADDPFIDEEDIIAEQYNTVSWNSSRTRVGIKVYTREHCVDQNTVRVTIEATCRRVASTPGAPSLQQQPLQQPHQHPEMDELSVFWEDLSQVPSETTLLPNYPNPFNPETWIPYHLAESADVTLTIYSADGRLIRTLALGHQPAGIYESKSRAAYWDGRNSIGERVASGLYFYTLTAGDFAATGKMLIMK